MQNTEIRKKFNPSHKKKSAPKKQPKKRKPKILHRVKKQANIARMRNKRDFSFEIDWNLVEVTDKTLSRLAEYLHVDEEVAFDRAFDILECHKQFRIDARWIYRDYMKKQFRGDWIHLQWHTFENVQIGIENNKWNRIWFDEDHLYVPDALAQEIYHAEDGRCEECGQAMHFRTAHFVKRDWTIFNDPNNIKLVCYCCNSGRSNMLLNPSLIILDRNMDYLKDKMGFKDIDSLKNYLRENLKYAVHTNTYNPNTQSNRKQVKMKIRGQYWLPGIGRCRLQYRKSVDGREYTLEFTECAKDPKLVVQPQKRSRGLLI